VRDAVRDVLLPFALTTLIGSMPAFRSSERSTAGAAAAAGAPAGVAASPSFFFGEAFFAAFGFASAGAAGVASAAGAGAGVGSLSAMIRNSVRFGN